MQPGSLLLPGLFMRIPVGARFAISYHAGKRSYKGLWSNNIMPDISAMMTILVGLGSFIGGALAAWAAYKSKMVTIRRQEVEVEKTEKENAIGVWEKANDRMSDEIRREGEKRIALETRVELQAKTIDAMRIIHTQEVDSARRAEAKCLAENAKQAAKMEIFQAELIHLRALVYSHGGSPAFATITANMEGVIVDASDEVKQMLGWRAAELVGKQIEFIIPEKFHAQHQAGLVRAKAGIEREEGKAITGEARTKNNGDVPVTVVLNYIVGEGGERRIMAELYNRRAAQEATK